MLIFALNKNIPKPSLWFSFHQIIFKPFSKKEWWNKITYRYKLANILQSSEVITIGVSFLPDGGNWHLCWIEIYILTGSITVQALINNKWCVRQRCISQRSTSSLGGRKRVLRCEWEAILLPYLDVFDNFS